MLILCYCPNRGIGIWFKTQESCWPWNFNISRPFGVRDIDIFIIHFKLKFNALFNVCSSLIECQQYLAIIFFVIEIRIMVKMTILYNSLWPWVSLYKTVLINSLFNGRIKKFQNYCEQKKTVSNMCLCIF